MYRRHKIKRAYIIITTVLFFSLFTYFVLVISPLKNTRYGEYIKSIINRVIDNTKRDSRINVPPINEDEILITCPNETEIQIYSVLPDKSILTTKFNKKEWDVWNIEGWYVSMDGFIPSSSLELMAGGGSDWEYVFRVKNNADEYYTFSGGNHGLEKLRTFKLTNPIDDSQIELQEGKEIILKRLRIEEETSLYFDETDTGKYAEVTRTYIVSPSKITLKTDFEFTNQVFIGTSYVCMLPITKKYGRYALFKESGSIYTTPTEGETLTTDSYENFLGKEASTTVEIWGDTRPNYRFVTSIKDGKMVNNFRNDLETFYWDVNQYGNKLYFSKHNNATAQRIEKGTKLEEYCEWEIDVR